MANNIGVLSEGMEILSNEVVESRQIADLLNKEVGRFKRVE